MINVPLASRPWLTSALVFLLLWPLGDLGTAHSASELRWATAWGAAPDSTGPSLSSKTVRQIARLSIGGSHVRLRLSNLFGAGPLSIGSVRVAIHAGGSTIQRDTDRAVTFTARPGVTIPKGADALSDPLEFPVKALAQLAVSIHVRDDGGTSTIHGTALQTATWRRRHGRDPFFERRPDPAAIS